MDGVNLSFSNIIGSNFQSFFYPQILNVTKMDMMEKILRIF